MERYGVMKTQLYQPKEAKSHSDKEIIRRGANKRKASIFIQTLRSYITSNNGFRRNVIKHINRTCNEFEIDQCVL
ncbi:MAG: hypothetical protein EZS28_034834 [Streblomastix strix]|uniref:Uncharacterized protein n=1 Tax=Streblomastix strix TaxID=222440 RepID=A0A5J4UI36_9EUKA|nr:MAG: hypothetical protein EZS28_034834 [Streblomastix strix]